MKISQAEARRLRKRVDELEEQINTSRYSWVRDYPGGVNFAQLQREQDWLYGSIKMARQLGHAVVVTQDDKATLQFFALPIAKP